MRIATAIICLSTPAFAWEFSPLPICTLTGPQTTVTYDAAIPEYTIRIENADGWPSDGTFSIQYNGPAPLVISTDRQQTDGTGLTVADRGFGNVLNGMARNESFTAQLGDQAVTIPLEGIGPALAAFWACPQPATS